MDTVFGLVLVLEIISLLQVCQIHSSVIKASYLPKWKQIMVCMKIHMHEVYGSPQWRLWTTLPLIHNIQLLHPSPGRSETEQECGTPIPKVTPSASTFNFPN